jgi:hypothetical protein
VAHFGSRAAIAGLITPNGAIVPENDRNKRVRIVSTAAEGA